MDTNKYPFILWLLLTAMVCAVFFLHIIENKKSKLDLQKKLGSELAREIIRSYWIRSVQLFVIMVFSFILIAFYDWQLRNSKEQLESLQSEIEINASKALNQQSEITKDEQKDYYPPIIEGTDQGDDESSNASEKNSIQDIFDIKKGTHTDSKNTADAIKTRYEELLVTYFLLRKCGKSSDSDYQSIISLLQKEIIASQAPSRLQYDTLTAAKGSYEELYSLNDCTKSDLETMTNQFDSYIKNLSNRLSAN
jgi:hypothetical protein